MRNLLILCILSLFFITASSAQERESGNCGVGYEEGFEIRAQMFQNRANIDRAQIQQLQNQRFTIWIPLVIHLIGNNQGQGFASPSPAVSMICRLNADFADQNIQFYIKDSIRFVKDDTIFVDAYDSIAIDRMILLKDTMAANVFINGSAGGGVAGYFSRRGDFVFILNSYANGSSTTITHEFGHFFTLPHTFFGWEGTNARALYFSTPAPDSILDSHGDKREVEYVARSGGQANCYSSADGFCDTDADYISSRWSCPLSGTALDPSGVAIAPNSRLFMSYALDNCMDSFSQEQKVAILTDVVNRNWTGFPAPSSTTMMSGAFISAISPLDASVQEVNSPMLRFEWDTVGASAASAWVIEIERMLFGTTVGTIARTIVNGQNYIDIPSSKFLSNGQYRWRVMPFSNGYTCANFGSYYNFNTGYHTNVKAENISDLAALQVLSNPVQGQILQFRLSVFQPIQGGLRLYASDGKLLFSENIQWLQMGEDLRNIDLSGYPAGIYQLVFVSDKGNLSKSFILSE